MLTGVYAPTEGDATIYGKSIRGQMKACRAIMGNCFQVRKTPRVGPEIGPTSAFYSCILTGMHGPACIFWANLTPSSLQHDVLYPDLTVNEHLQLFAGLKGVPGAERAGRIREAIAAVGLTEKADVISASLSGGMKRKLSLSIALIGGAGVSKCVFLDEPTSGMDPYSRRSTWNMLQV